MIILVYFYVQDFYTIATLSLFRPKPTVHTNSEVWVVTDFSVTVIQIKKTLTKKRSYIRLCVQPGHVQLPNKYPGFFGGVSKFLCIHIQCPSWKYNFGCIFKITCPCSKEIILLYSVYDYIKNKVPYIPLHNKIFAS